MAVLGGAAGSLGFLLGRRSSHSPAIAATFRVLGDVPVHSPRMGHAGFEALVGCYAIDALYTDAGSRAGLVDRLRSRYHGPFQDETRSRIPSCSTSVIASYCNSCSDSRTNIPASCHDGDGPPKPELS